MRIADELKRRVTDDDIMKMLDNEQIRWITGVPLCTQCWSDCGECPCGPEEFCKFSDPELLGKLKDYEAEGFNFKDFFAREGVNVEG